MLAWRVAISAILIPLLLAVFYIDARVGEPAWGLLALMELLALRGVWELCDLFRGRIPRLQPQLLMLLTGGVVLAAWIPHLPGTPLDHLDLTPLALTYCFALMLLCGVEAARFSAPGGSLESLAVQLFIVSYVGVLLAVTAQLRWVAGGDAGYLAIGSLVLCCKGGDIGAYFIGKRFGRRKLAPLLSPAKTWAGVAGAILGAGLCGWLWFALTSPFFLPGVRPGSPLAAMFYGAILGVAGIVGDLSESLLKRDVSRKDSAALLPGFGGLLDLIDSILYAGPVALLLWKVLPLTGGTVLP
jgi:phosphatidate cytidylyltransferase